MATDSSFTATHSEQWQLLLNNQARLLSECIGGTLGGPIYKNRAFFSVAYQGLRNSTAQTQLTRVFTSEQRDGDFSANGTLSSNPIPFPGGLQGPGGYCPVASDSARCIS
jgi:hypothetical protein